MGLDIHISTNNPEKLYTADYYSEKNNYFYKHSLSREFCNLMLRQQVVEHEPELDQIGKITEVDISLLYEMESYPNEDELQFRLDTVESEKEKEDILNQAETDKMQLQGNIDKVLQTINSLIEKLKGINNLSTLFLPTNFDISNVSYYFSDFETDKGEGYIGNNFGQDLRNFKRFLEFAKERGTTTVWFQYG